MVRKTLIIFFLLAYCSTCFGTQSFRLFPENDSLKNRKKWVVYGGIGSTAAIHTGLYFAWYANYPKSSFHFLDDSKEWLQMDKFGHAYSAYYLGLMGYESSLWAGYSTKQAARNGLIYGTLFQTMIEVFDGFSEQWGASGADLIANTAGSALFYAQARVWEDQKIILKYHYRQSPYPKNRPNLLGKGLHQEFLKDYNGQSYWLSFNPFDVLGKSSKYFPEGVCLSLGYGANGMLGGYDNLWTDTKTGIAYDFSHIPRYRQYFVSADINWVKLLKPKKRSTKVLLTVLNAIKIPMPTLEFRGKEMGGTKFWWLY